MSDLHTIHTALNPMRENLHLEERNGDEEKSK